MFKQKPTISDGKANYMKLVFLNIQFPTMFPLHPEKINGLEKNDPRKVYAKSMNSLDNYGRIDGIFTQVLFTGMIRQV